MINYIKLFLSFGITFGLNFISKFFTAQGVNTWYLTLKKSPLTPPDYAFGVVWFALYTLMSFATYLIWKEQKKISFTIYYYFIHLLLNVLWCYSFFYLHNQLMSCMIITLLLAAIGYLLYLYKKESNTAFLLILPYFLWVSFATYLSLYMFISN
jgi:translocator protein